MSYLKINGIEFDVDVSISDYKENFNVLDGPNAGRGLSGRMVRDVLGTYIGHNISIARKGWNYTAHDEVWEYLKQHSVDDSVMLEAADSQTTLSYEAYYTSAERPLEQKVNGINLWGAISINFIPMEAQLTP